MRGIRIGTSLIVSLLASRALAQKSHADTPPPLRGSVIDEAGEPVAGALIEVVEGSSLGDVLKSAQLAQADERGHFELAAGAATIGFKPRWVRVTAPKYISQAVRSAMNPLHDDLGTVVLRRARTAQVIVRDANGPIAGARVRADSSDKVQLGLTVYELDHITDERGIARIECAPYGPLRCEISADGYFTRVLPCAREPILVELEPSGFVSGTLVDDAGKPSAGRVKLGWARGAGVGAMNERFAESVAVGPDGRFRLPLSYPDRYRVEALSSVSGVERSAKSAVLVGPQEDLRLELGGKTATVRVTHGDGKPVRGGEYSVIWMLHSLELPDFILQGSYLRHWGPIGADGVIEVAKPFSSGCEAQVFVRARGAVVGSVRVKSFGAGAETRLELPRLGWIEGVARDSDGNPAAFARVGLLGRYEHVGDNLTAMVRADAHGKFRLEAPAGECELVGWHPGHRRALRRVAVEGGAVARSDLEFRPATAARGQVVGGAVEAGWTIQFVDSDATAEFHGALRNAALDAKGRFVFADGSAEGLDAKPIGFGRDVLGVTGANIRWGVHEEDGLALVDADGFELARLRGRIHADGVEMTRIGIVLCRNKAHDYSVKASADSAGRFDVRVVPGEYSIALIDRATGCLLHQTKSMSFANGQTVELKLRPSLSRVIVDVVRPDRGTAVQGLRVFDSSVPSEMKWWSPYGQVDLSTSAATFELMLPEGEHELHLVDGEFLGSFEFDDSKVHRTIESKAGTVSRTKLELPALAK